MVHWRNFISSPTEIDPVAEKFVKRVIFDCLNLNRYILVHPPVESIFLRNIGNALNIISFEFFETIQAYMGSYPLERVSVQSHMTFLHQKLKELYIRSQREHPPVLSYYIVLALALEVIYFIWTEMPQIRKIELTYGTVCILSRLFSSREFTTQCSLGQLIAYANQIIRENFDLFCFFRKNIEIPYQPQRPTSLNFLEDIPIPDDRYSPDSPISAPSWSDSGVSIVTVSTATSGSSSSGYATPSSAELQLPIVPAPIVPVPMVPAPMVPVPIAHLPAMPHPDIERHIFRRFLPQRGRMQYISRFMPRFRLLRRFRRFHLALSRSL